MTPRIIELVAAPIVAGVLVLMVGAAGLISREPWLIPSLGATAMFVAIDPMNRSSRPHAILFGHLTALSTSLFAVWICNAWWDPALLTTGNLTAARLLSAVVAVVSTTLISSAIDAVHPASGATALLVALGSLQSGAGVLSLATGAALVSALSAPVRWISIWALTRRAASAPSRRRMASLGKATRR